MSPNLHRQRRSSWTYTRFIMSRKQNGVQALILEKTVHVRFLKYTVQRGSTRKRSWLRNYAANLKVAGSNPDEITVFQFT
jgi:hypothetical protein